MPKTATKSLKVVVKETPAPRAGMPSLTVSRPELLVNGSDQQFRRLVHSLFGFLAKHVTIRDGHGAYIGLAGIEYTVLISIGHLSADGDVSVRDIADHLHFSGAFVTTVTNKLLAKGLIEKTSDPTDRRRLCLTVTKAGRKLLEQLAPRQRRINDVQFDCLSAEEFCQLLDMVERLVDSGSRAVALQRYLEETAPPHRVSDIR